MSATTSSPRYVLLEADLLPQISQFQVGVPDTLHAVFKKYLKKVKDSDVRADPALRRGYVLVHLIYERDYVSIALLFRHCHEQEFKCPIPCKKYPFVIDEAVAMDHLPLVQFLHEHDFGKASPRAMDTAAADGDLDMVEYLHTHRTEGCTREAFKLAKKLNHRAVVDFLNAHRAVVDFLNAHRAADRDLSYYENEVVSKSERRSRQVVDGLLVVSTCVVQ